MNGEEEEPQTGPVQPENRWALREAAVDRRLQSVADVQRQICKLQAQQVHEVAAFVTERNALDTDLGIPSSPGQYRSMVAEISLACHLSVLSAQSFMADAYLLATCHPFTAKALADGVVNLTTARAVAREASHIDDPDKAALADQVIAEELPDVPPGRIRSLIDRRIMEIDPDAASRKAATERADKHVTFEPGSPGTAHLNAYLPAEQAETCWQALHDHARTMRAAGDPRSVSHLMCDTLVERVTGTTGLADVKVHLNLVMSDNTLFGADDRPAELSGCGPIPAPVARLIAATGNTWLKRLYTDPIDGTLVSADPRRRRFAAEVRDFVLIRDSHCRGINCASPMIDIDHIIEYSRGGHTAADNGQALSKNCHTMREHPRMRVHAEPDTGAVVWQTPSGLSHRTLPPPVLGPGSTTLQQLHYRQRVLHPPPSLLEQKFLRYYATAQRQKATTKQRPSRPRQRERRVRKSRKTRRVTPIRRN